MVRGAARRRPGRARAQRDLRRPRHPPVGALHDRARRAPRAPVLLRRDRRDRHGRDRLGGEHQPPARAPARRCPRPHDADLAFFVREAWPSALTGTRSPPADRGTGGSPSRCELGDGGVVFGDGIEADRVARRLGPADRDRRGEPDAAPGRMTRCRPMAYDYVLFPGRHHLLTRFQGEYLERAVAVGVPDTRASTPTAAARRSSSPSPAPTTATPAATRSRATGARRRSSASPRWRAMDCLVFPVADVPPTERFADYVLDAIAAQERAAS